MEGQEDKALVSVLSLVLLVVPMLVMIFSTIYYYNMSDFVSLMLAQPVQRGQVLGSLLIGLGLVFSLVVAIGLGYALWWLHWSSAAWSLLLVALALVWVFVSMAIFAGVVAKDKARGMGLSLLIWAYFILVFDGVVLLLMYNFSDYPIEKVVLMITFLNPVDLGRVLVLMRTEAAALMGYSGAVFKHFFESTWSTIVALMALLVWVILPLLLSLRLFRHKNL
ncbi:ABC transporter permease subunit [Echinicola rosea]|uniref:ABC transporter permease subunit n=1 Tax=Echinicola rosea TaxID=1807691 RepID=UPI00165188A1|nr:ABC transporter permease subunit [Echinicola rosea]